MFNTFLGSVLILFFVMSLPAMLTRAPVSSYIARNFVAALFISACLMLAFPTLPAALFLAGFGVCGGLALRDRREGAKFLALEVAVAALLILAIIVLKDDAGGLFRGRGLRPSLEHLEGSLYALGLPLRSQYFGLYFFGGALGWIASYPLRPRLQRKLAAVSWKLELRRRRALPQAAVFGDKMFAPWRLVKKSRRRLSARIDKVTQ